MTNKQTYWIASVGGHLAQVEGAEERDAWTKIHGWHEVTEPRPSDRTYIWHDGIDQPGCVPYESLPDWVAMDWRPGPPPPPVDVANDPTLRDLPAVAPPVAEPAKPKTASAAGGEKTKE